MTPDADIEAMLGLGDGFVSRALERLQLARDARLRVGRLAVILAAVTWLPLLGLSIVEGVAWGKGVHVPFVMDYLPYGQLLIAIPVLVLGELTVSRYLILALAELRRSEVLDPSDRRCWMNSWRKPSRAGAAAPSTRSFCL